MKADYDMTEENIKSIDERIEGDYAPKFRSPSEEFWVCLILTVS